MSPFHFDCLPANLPGGFFIYRATGTEELCFADGNVLDVIVDADYIDDELGDVRCILSLRKK